jgi:hypothetical protein
MAHENERDKYIRRIIQEAKDAQKKNEEFIEELKADDLVNHPRHYTKGGIETIDVIKAKLGVNFKYYVKGNLMKYADRLGEKDSWIQELGKIAWYANDLKEFLKKLGDE